ncbi:ribonuclease H-like domain-containing protein [Tanacetum coccineum]
MIVEYKLLKEGIMVHFQLIRVDGSSKRYSSMIRMLQDIDREDLETLWKLVKTKHGDLRPEDEHERVLLEEDCWDLKTSRLLSTGLRSIHWDQQQAMTEPSWIDAMQEEIHEFERLEVWELVPCLDNVFLIKLKWIYKIKTDESGGDTDMSLTAYVDVDHAGCQDTRRSTSGSAQFLESPKRQKLEDDKETDEHEEVEADDTAELKKHLVIKRDDDIAIDAIPLATKPPMIVEYKLLKEGIMVHYQLIRADGSSKRYSSMIRMLQDINRKDLETLWKLVKTKHGDLRPEDEYERVLWGDLKVMFEPDIKSKVWRDLQVCAAGYKDTTAAELKLLEDLQLSRG